MKSKLDKMLEELNPIEDWIEKEKRGNEILRKYCNILETNTIKDGEVTVLIKEFMIPLIFRKPLDDEDREFWDDKLLDIALKKLKKFYPKNTFWTVSSIITSGAEGGVYQVLKNLMNRFVEERAKGEIGGKINSYLDELDDPQIRKLANEYNERYSHFLSERYRDNLDKIFWDIDIILLEHFIQLKKLREIKN